jgi:hypothetical protein
VSLTVNRTVLKCSFNVCMLYSTPANCFHNEKGSATVILSRLFYLLQRIQLRTFGFMNVSEHDLHFPNFSNIQQSLNFSILLFCGLPEIFWKISLTFIYTTKLSITTITYSRWRMNEMGTQQRCNDTGRGKEKYSITPGSQIRYPRFQLSAVYRPKILNVKFQK